MQKDLLWVLFGVLLIGILFLGGCTSNVSKDKQGVSHEISAEEVFERYKAGEELYIVDVRTPEEFQEKHIPGAILIPVDDLEARYQEIPDDREVILVCRSARRSGIATEFLVSKGYTNVKNMLGGMIQWNALDK